MFACLLLAAPPPAWADDSLPRAQQASFRAALAAAARSIVRIETIGGAQPARDASDPQRTTGFRTADGPTTGVIWSEDGVILSSTFNFVRDPTVITVQLADGRRFVGKLLARDQQSRLALLKVEARGLPAAKWVDAAAIRPGQWAIAAGFGHGSREPALSVGVISGVNRMSGQCVQTDAKTSPANYGGPLLDLSGRMVGVCVPMGTGDDEFAGVDQYDSGIGFAVHADHIRRRLPRMLKGETLKRGLLGLVLDPRDPVVGEPWPDEHRTPPMPLASRPDDKPLPPRQPDGLAIVAPRRGPAAEAGLAEGDVITQVDGEPTIRLIDFRRIVARKAAGDTVEVAYRREKTTATITLKLWSADDFRSTSQPASQPR
ncbi:MAG: trypsin-like peptidase domain-containing protein [Planctomycetes bacterium]|nr:trypsin-like peptidase domain-containing protein [Planctomycetota bacterium]